LVAARPDVAIDVLVARRREELGRVQLDARALMAEMTPTSSTVPTGSSR